MFVLRSLFWLGAVVMLLPASPDGETPAPRVSLVEAAYSARILLQDVTGVCERNPEACARSREALALVGRKLETGAGAVVAGIAAGRMLVDAGAGHGTLTTADLAAPWSIAEARP
jgi:hypothetical protein